MAVGFAFSTLGTGIVSIYDSSPNPGNPSSAVENAIAKLVHTEAAMLTLKFMGCDQQSNTRKCGLFAIEMPLNWPLRGSKVQ